MYMAHVAMVGMALFAVPRGVFKALAWLITGIVGWFVSAAEGEAADWTFNNYKLTVEGDGNANNIWVWGSSGSCYVEIDGDIDYVAPTDSVLSISIVGNGGNDTIGASGINHNGGWGLGAIELHGGLGNDLLMAAKTYATSLFGDAGADSIQGDEAGDFIEGGAGNDTLHGFAANDTIHGNDGDDAIDGTDGNDSLLGEAGNDTIWGDGGNDVILGGDEPGGIVPGGDSILGGFGNDTVLGQDGHDIIAGGSGNDSLYGNDDLDWINGNDGDDTIHGGNQEDSIWGDNGADSLAGGGSNGNPDKVGHSGSYDNSADGSSDSLWGGDWANGSIEDWASHEEFPTPPDYVNGLPQ